MDKALIKAKLRDFGGELLSYFKLTSELEPQAEAEASIRSGVSFKGSQLLVLIFAIFIASLGLNTNSIPVIIGAMLISPLMGPIIGMGLGIGINDFQLLKRGLKNIIMAVAGSILASALYFIISPQLGGATQLLARTSPSIYDVFVALFGGAAGIVSIGCKNKGQVMPGVAIATSLMPPLCTAGYGLATWSAHFFFGALYLFFTNMIFILVAAWVGVKLFGYKSVVYEDEKRAKRVHRIVTAVVVATVGFSAFLTIRMIQTNLFLSRATAFVETDMVFPNTQVLNHKEYVEHGKRHLEVTLIGEQLPMDSLKAALLTRMDSVGLGGTLLTIKQGFALNGAPVKDGADMDRLYALMSSELTKKEEQLDSLRGILQLRKSMDDLSVSVVPELKVLFPSVKDISITRMIAASTTEIDVPVKTSAGEKEDKAESSEKATKQVTKQATKKVMPVDTVNMVFVNAPKGLTASERKKLREYIAVRMNIKEINLTVNPQGFPWPKE